MPRKPRPKKPEPRLQQPPEFEEAWRLASVAHEKALARGETEEQALESARRAYRKAVKVLVPHRT